MSQPLPTQIEEVMGLLSTNSIWTTKLPVFPPIGFLRSIVVRATGIWIALHAVLLGMFKVISLEALATLAVVAVVTGLTTLHGRRTSEHIFLANLGVPEWLLIVAAAIPPSLLEFLVKMIA